MSEHTKGRLVAKFQGDFGYDINDDMGGTLCTIESKPDAKRAVACWNALEGLSTEAIEARTVSLPTALHQAERERAQFHQELTAARAQNEKLTAMVQEQDRLLGKKACATKECLELLAARALLREVVQAGYLSDTHTHRIRNYLDACDSLGGGNG